MVGSQTGVPKGASHGIGHVLGGTAHVPHGYTSCVMLPHVLRFNSAVNADRQALVSEALGRPGDPAADVVAGLIAALGLPQTLRDVGVKPISSTASPNCRCTTAGSTPIRARSTGRTYPRIARCGLVRPTAISMASAKRSAAAASRKSIG